MIKLRDHTFAVPAAAILDKDQWIEMGKPKSLVISIEAAR